ncbi:hypothetical protein BU16DRAFT_560836 [Lophium mytilinum]|uniref:Uncharacterized protein n=1 Tax=Lophium mytilinum TaxID=390894 RepID=A0A6A6QWC4_9PEZI|nr:hypothetical protein BU16DRAFT_560836 [Lophium mytilinum]
MFPDPIRFPPAPKYKRDCLDELAETTDPGNSGGRGSCDVIIGTLREYALSVSYWASYEVKIPEASCFEDSEFMGPSDWSRPDSSTPLRFRGGEDPSSVSKSSNMSGMCGSITMNSVTRSAEETPTPADE